MSRRPQHLRTILTAAAVLTLAGPAAVASEADDTLATMPDEAYASSIRALDPSVRHLDEQVRHLETRISEFDTTSTEGSETVITMSSDVLFEFDKADLDTMAKKKIAEVVKDVPRGATVTIGGHTDSISDDSYNQKLSERRATSVAAVVKKARPDLELDVQGFGETQPVADNESGGEDNPEGRALNRRVEIRYDG